MILTKLKVLLFTKATSWCDKVGEFCKRNFDCTWIKDFFRENDILETNKEYDYIISYLSPWIIRKEILERAKIAAINFHPGPPKYPGIGGYNFALYNGDKEYGCVVHKMVEKVDSGPILDFIRFDILPNDTVETLKERSMLYLFYLFSNLAIRFFLKGESIKIFEERTWEREPYTRTDLQILCEKSVEWDIDHWYNACYFPNALDKPYICVKDKKYYIIREDHYDEGHIPRWKLSSSYWNST